METKNIKAYSRVGNVVGEAVIQVFYKGYGHRNIKVVEYKPFKLNK